jgi:hypothetical protein
MRPVAAKRKHHVRMAALRGVHGSLAPNGIALALLAP